MEKVAVAVVAVVVLALPYAMATVKTLK